MVIFKNSADIKKYILDRKLPGSLPGFVPTMGALHKGHVSLVEKAKADGMLVICSIFINPTQFNDKKDFERYPVSTRDDIEMLINAGCDVLFLPTESEIYPNGKDAAKAYDFGYLETIFEGAQRPGHFHGVGQVVARLLEIIEPVKLYLGRKDFQQCLVITKLVELIGQTEPEVVICPTVREADGLAMSSRNRRLTESQRSVAGTIYQCLVSIESKQKTTDFSVVRKECTDILSAKGFVPEYIALADATTLEPLDNYDNTRSMVALIAARIGEIRLIDNILIEDHK